MRIKPWGCTFCRVSPLNPVANLLQCPVKISIARVTWISLCDPNHGWEQWDYPPLDVTLHHFKQFPVLDLDT